MELKVTLIVALVTAITISVHAQRARGGRRNGRVRGQGRFGGSPGSDRSQMTGGPRQGGPPMGGRRCDGPGQGDQQMDGRGPNGGPMGGRRFDGPGFGGFRPEGAGRPFFGHGGMHADGEGEMEVAQPIGDGQGWPGRFDGPGRFSGRPYPGRDGHDKADEQSFGQQNDGSCDEDGRPHRPHPPHHHHDRHNNTDDHHHHNHPEGRRPHHHYNTEEGGQDRPEMRPFRFFHLFRKQFGGRPFGRCSHHEEGCSTRDGDRRPNGDENERDGKENEEEEHLPTESMTTCAVIDVIEIDINIIPEV
uniref:185/333 n=1 Tax=Heliocidaris erythrogramma TaxID=7634 RepID=I3W7Z0_HELER|nr:185/333 [Heliocidaris erythrogramma]